MIFSPTTKLQRLRAAGWVSVRGSVIGPAEERSGRSEAAALVATGGRLDRGRPNGLESGILLQDLTAKTFHAP